MNEPDPLRCYVKLPTVLAVELTVDGTVGPIDWLSFKVKVKRLVAFVAWILASTGC